MAGEHGTDKSGTEIMDQREYTYTGIEDFFDSDLEYARRYDDHAAHVIRSDEGLSRKIRELILVAMACVEGRVVPCLNHIRDARTHGATEQEVVRTIQLAGFAGPAWGIKTGSEALQRYHQEQGGVEQ